MKPRTLEIELKGKVEFVNQPNQDFWVVASIPIN